VKNNPNLIAISIIIAGLIIAGSIFLTRGDYSEEPIITFVSAAEIEDFRLPNETDHVRGKLDAPITVIEYSDFECPFCGRLHPTLNKLIEDNDDIKWVYRHFPLSGHNNALGSAIASECVAELAGNDAFWAFSDVLFTNQENLNQNLYDNEAQKLGIDLEQFKNCIDNPNITQKVREDLDEIISIGGRGTPFSVVITKNNNIAPFSGALPYNDITEPIDIKRIIEEARKN
jgi:protein-disulfide isomerase